MKTFWDKKLCAEHTDQHPSANFFPPASLVKSQQMRPGILPEPCEESLPKGFLPSFLFCQRSMWCDQACPGPSLTHFRSTTNDSFGGRSDIVEKR
eukprot:600819-Rhodomonas_salina.4